MVNVYFHSCSLSLSLVHTHTTVMVNMATPTTGQKGVGLVTEVGVAVGRGLVATALAATVNSLDTME